MNKRVVDFLSSVGVMVLGVTLVFVGSITFTARPVEKILDQSSVAQVEPFKKGGDELLPVLPVSRPAIPLLNSSSTEYTGTLTATTVMVVDDLSNAILYKKNPDEVRSLASITKLMSALVVSDLSLDWTTSTVITDEDYDPSSHHLIVGEEYTLEDLWRVALVGSSNSAVRALVRATGLTEDEFAKKMNEKASALGLNSLQFVEPTGLNSKNMGKAVDILRLLKAALKEERIAETLKMAEYYAQPLNKKTKRHVWSTDWLLTNWVPNNFDKDVLVGKTGYIEQSGYNFVVRIPGQKSHVIRVVILGAESNELRFSEARDLAEWIFSNYVWPDDEDFAKLTTR
jgi:D-alanyl-D-alanine endopeptidase (penicillin-binding protein 7)